MPKSVKTYINDKGVVWVDINEKQIAKKDYQVIDGDFKEINKNFLPGKFTLTGKTDNGAIIQIQTTDFPGWTIDINGKSAKIKNDNKYHLITISVPSGTHTISGKFADTNPRHIGNLITLVSLVGLTGLFVYGTRRNI